MDSITKREMNKSIIELCRNLPHSEQELRERLGELDEQLAIALGIEACSGWDLLGADANGAHIIKLCNHAEGKCDPLESWPRPYSTNIEWAKVATDATKCGNYYREVWYGKGKDYHRWRLYFPGGRIINLERYAEATARTEELARAACALLALEAMSQSGRFTN